MNLVCKYFTGTVLGVGAYVTARTYYSMKTTPVGPFQVRRKVDDYVYTDQIIPRQPFTSFMWATADLYRYSFPGGAPTRSSEVEVKVLEPGKLRFWESVAITMLTDRAVEEEELSPTPNCRVAYSVKRVPSVDVVEVDVVVSNEKVVAPDRNQ